MAEAAGVYDEFKAVALIGKEAMLNALVAEGKLTEADAEEILADLAECDGEKSDILKKSGLFGLKDGSGFGSGQGQGNGAKAGSSAGLGAGTQNRGGNGQRIMDGSCKAN